MIPYFLFLLLWLLVAVVWPAIQTLHNMNEPPASKETQKIWLFYWACFVLASFVYPCVAWVVEVPFYVLSYYVDLYYEAQLVFLICLVSPNLFYIKSMYRKLDVFAMVMFNATLLLLMLPTNFLAAKLGLVWLGRVPEGDRVHAKARLARLVIAISRCVWRLAFKLCPWIQLDIYGEEEFWAGCGASGRPVCVLSNHTSFLDILLTVCLVPTPQCMNIKMTVSDHVGRMPVIGTICTSMDHSYIPFKSQSVDDFELDQEGVSSAMSKLSAHIGRGGNIACFPEGTINRGDFHEPKMFRAGGFKQCMDHDMEVWCLASVGNPICWHPRKPVGGKPARIAYTIFRVCESSHAFCADAPPKPDKDATRSKQEYLADSARDKCAEALAELVKKGYTSFKENEPTKKD